MKTIFKADIVEALKKVGLKSGGAVMVHTSLGSAELKLMSQRELVDFATQWIEKNRIEV